MHGWCLGVSGGSCPQGLGLRCRVLHSATHPHPTGCTLLVLARRVWGRQRVWTDRQRGTSVGQLRLFLADKPPPGLRHTIFLAFRPGHPLSILALALQEGFGDGGGWEPISIVWGMEVTCFAAGETCREFFHCCLSHLNSVTSSVSEPALAKLPPSARQGLWAGALPVAQAAHHLHKAVLGKKYVPLWGLSVFWAGWSGPEGTEDLPSTGWDSVAESSRLLGAGRFPPWSLGAGANLPPTPT